MRPLIATLLAVSLASVLAGCHAAPEAATPILPLRTLRLYESGVGYFERSGEMTDASAGTSLPVPAGHLDDALKSLVVIGRGGHVEGVEFGSSVSKGMARALAGLPLDTDAPITYRDVLASLRGVAIEVTTADGVIEGRLVDVQDPPGRDADAARDGRDKGPGGDGGSGAPKAARPEEPTLLLVTKRAELLRIAGRDVASVHPTDPAFAGRFDAALDALSTSGARTPRQVRLLASSRGPVTLGYVAETPVWRTTYRLVLDAAGRGGALQGWALLHNDTDEDWRGVRVQLVNGRPDSFLFPLAAPRYTRRPLAHPEEELSTVPQLLGKTPDAIWGDHLDDATSVGGIGLVGTGEGGGGSGYGSGQGRLGGSHVSRAPQVRSSDVLTIGNLADVDAATGVESGALFTYALARPLDLRARGSALVPFVQQPVDVQRITWFASPSSPGRTAVRLTNSTRQTLPAGPIAFFSQGGFAGEAGLDRMKPGEKRFVEYGADLDVELHAHATKTQEVTKRLAFADGTLEEHFLRTIDTTFAIENRSGDARSLYVALAIDANGAIEGADRIEFDAEAKRPIAVLDAPGRRRAERRVVSREGLVRRTAIADVEAAYLEALVAAPELRPQERAAATEATARRKELGQTEAAIAKAKADIEETEKDLARLREHMKALGGGDKGGGAGSAAPLVARVLAGEDRLTALRKRLESLEGEAKTRGASVRAALEHLAGA